MSLKQRISKLNPVFVELLFYIFVAVFVFAKGALFAPDSYAFLAGDINRSPGYVLFLDGLQLLFSNVGYPVIFIQLALNILALHLVCSYFCNLFKLNILYRLFILIILAAPLLHLHFIANFILTEGICYPLFLIVCTYLLKAAHEKSELYLLKAFTITLLLMFFRGQFAFMLPVEIAVSLYVFSKTRNKKCLLAIALFVATPWLHSFNTKTFHYFKHGHFVNTPFAAISFITPSLYVSDKDDVTLFKTEEEQLFFSKVHFALSENKMNYTSAENTVETSYFEHYKTNFVSICNHTIHPIAMQMYADQGLSSNDQFIKANTLASKMWWPLTKDNFSKWLRLYVQNVKAALGNSRILLLHFLLFACGFLLYKKKHKKLGLTAIILFALVLSNVLATALATHSLKRYLFYGDWVIFVFIILLISTLIRKGKENF